MADKLSKLLRQRILANNKAKESADLLTDKATDNIKWNAPTSNDTSGVLLDPEDIDAFELELVRLRALRFNTDIVSKVDANGVVTLGADDLSNNLRSLRSTLDKHKSELRAAGNSNEVKLIRANIAKLQKVIADGRKKTEKILVNAASGPGLLEIMENVGGLNSSLERIKDNIISILKNTKAKKPNKTLVSSDIVGNISFGAASTIASLQKSLQKLKSSAQTGRLRDKSGKFFSLIRLTDLLNSRLEEAIKRNMGTGTSKSVLNYQSGRFARTVSINRITLGRTGYATIFYDWMKYPYETFSPGFAQGNIRTRDPKLLISKSIREIAADLISNKFKSVST